MTEEITTPATIDEALVARLRRRIDQETARLAREDRERYTKRKRRVPTTTKRRSAKA